MMSGAAAVAAGQLDPGFGNGGVVVARTLPYVQALAVQDDGKVVALATLDGAGGTAFELARFNADGSLDRSFGYRGKVVTGFGAGATVARALAIQPDGKIIAIGYGDPRRSPDDIGNYYHDVAEVARYNVDGSLDTAFGQGGTVLSRFGIRSADVDVVAVAPDGKIVLSGPMVQEVTGASPALLFGAAVFRLNADGSPDATFGDGGTAVIPNAAEDPSRATYADAMALQPDGEVLVATDVATDTGRSGGILRFETNGSVDPDFANPIDPGFVVDGYGLAVQRDGRILAAGYFIADAADPAATRALVARFRPDGSPDPTFGDGGWALLPLPAGVTGDAAARVQVDAAGRVIVAEQLFGPDVTRAAVARLTPAGAPDATFGHHGVTCGALPGSYVDAEAVDPSSGMGAGDIVVGALSGDGLVIARLAGADRPAAVSPGRDDADAPVPEVVPNAPFDVTAPSTGGVRLTFHDNSDVETSFVIERATGLDGPTYPLDESAYASIATIPASVGRGMVTYVDVTAAPGKGYTYRVRAANATGRRAGRGRRSRRLRTTTGTTATTFINNATDRLNPVRRLRRIGPHMLSSFSFQVVSMGWKPMPRGGQYPAAAPARRWSATPR